MLDEAGRSENHRVCDKPRQAPLPAGVEVCNDLSVHPGCIPPAPSDLGQLASAVDGGLAALADLEAAEGRFDEAREMLRRVADAPTRGEPRAELLKDARARSRW